MFLSCDKIRDTEKLPPHWDLAVKQSRNAEPREECKNEGSTDQVLRCNL